MQSLFYLSLIYNIDFYIKVLTYIYTIFKNQLQQKDFLKQYFLNNANFYFKDNISWEETEYFRKQEGLIS